MNEEANFKIINNGSKYIKVTNIVEKSYDIMNKDGEPESVRGVQFMVIGKNRIWKDWIEYEKFIVANPDFIL